MLEKVKEGDLAIFKDGEERRIECITIDYNIVAICFNEPIVCAKDVMPSRWWGFEFGGEVAMAVDGRNDIVKVVHIEKDDVS